MMKKCFSQSLNNDGRVAFDEKQCLTPKQKEQARKNIGALGIGDVPEELVEEAPKDGIQYGRQNGTWTPVIGKVYEGVDEIHIDNDNNTISLDKSNIASKTELAAKQDKLIPGSHIEIDENNTIKVVGDFGKVYEGEGKITVNNTTNKISVDLSEQATKAELSNEASNRISKDNELKSEIDALEISSDVTYVVNSYSDLPTTATADEYAKVLNDTTHENKTSYYQYKSDAWTYVGSIGPYITAEELEYTNMIIEGNGENDITSSITLIKDNKFVQWSDGKLYADAHSSHTDFIPIDSRYKLKINVGVWIRSGCGIAFYSEANQNAYISGIDTHQVTIDVVEKLFDVPANAKYFRANYLSDEYYQEGMLPFACVLLYPSFPKTVEKVESLESQVGTFDDKIEKLEASVNTDGENDITSTVTLVKDGKFVQYYDGKLYTDTRASHTDFVFIDGAKKIKITAGCYNRQGTGLAFYTSNTEASYTGVGEDFRIFLDPNVIEKVIDVPEGANYFRSTFLSDATHTEAMLPFSCVLLYNSLPKTIERVDNLEEQVGTFDSRITNVENTVAGYDERIETVETSVTELGNEVTKLGNNFSLDTYETTSTFTNIIYVNVGDVIALTYLDKSNWLQPDSGYAVRWSSYNNNTLVHYEQVGDVSKGIDKVFVVPEGVNNLRLEIRTAEGGYVKFRYGTQTYVITKQIVDESLLVYRDTIYEGEKIITSNFRNTWHSERKWSKGTPSLKNLSQLIPDGVVVTDDYIIIQSSSDGVANADGFYIMNKNYNYITDIKVPSGSKVGNILSLGEKYESTDKIPLLYTAYGTVWRLDIDNDTATLIQTISLEGTSSNQREFIFDRELEIMYVKEKFGGRTDNLRRSDLYKFKMPKITDGDVTISLDDNLGKVTILGAYLNQDCFVDFGKLYCAAGLGIATAPNELDVIDIGSGSIVSRIKNPSGAGSSNEPEGIFIRDNKIYWLDLYGMYEFQVGV